MPAPLRSMTGFARVRRPLGDGELVVSVKSVNHRGLDLVIQTPPALEPFEGAIRALVKAGVARGHVEVRVSLPKSANGEAALALDRKFLYDYLRIFREETAAQGLESKPDLNAALRIPGMFTAAESGGPPEGVEAVLQEALAAALEELNEFRAREGGAIVEELRGHNQGLSAAAERMEQLRAAAADYFQKRLAERLQEVAKGVQVDPQRLAQEAAILADRSDIGEELARLKIHSGQLAMLLDGGGEVGKKLDFLLQEMNRETNTILSKTSGAGAPAMQISDLALAAKAAIEKIREQALNLE
ncbi:MAG: YicC family protein [Acidobacteriota bacterium]|nr:YicC family protein [Acidobacteriota bacterium]